MNKPEVIINIEDIYNKNDENNKLNQKLLSDNDNSYCCYNCFECLLYCFL